MYKTSKKAIALLNTLPKKSLTLNVILKKGLTSDNFQIIKLKNLQEKVLKYKAQIPFDTYLSTSFLKGNDKSASIRPEAPYNNRFTTGNVKLSHQFSTGTSVSLESNYNYTNSLSASFLDRTNSINTKYYENKINLTIRQNLLKNAFGYSSRKMLTALQTQQNNIKNQFSVDVENWSYKLIETFYTAWLLKSQVRVTQSNYYRQKRLRKITYLKFKRGTAKKSDFLQTQSAEKKSKQELNSARQDLENIWRNLVIQLNFPKQWININPMDIPIKLDQPLLQAIIACKTDLDIQSNWKVKFLTQQYKASKLNFLAAKNQMLPEVYLGIKASSNAINPNDKAQAFKDSLQNKNQGLFVELGVSIPLGRYKEKSQLAKTLMDKSILQHRLSSVKKDLQAQWKNECLNLSRLITKKKALKAIRSMQKTRARLEEKRFRIGKIPVFNNIQAGSDAAISELAFKQSEVHVRLSAWKILKMNTKLITYITKLSTNH
ncbi:MAG: TolC family protein [Bdellovibrionaceae bacterium]|nr:TolC family protein [Pseudobdellovibrionaceae bacterium]